MFRNTRATIAGFPARVAHLHPLTVQRLDPLQGARRRMGCRSRGRPGGARAHIVRARSADRVAGRSAAGAGASQGAADLPHAAQGAGHRVGTAPPHDRADGGVPRGTDADPARSRRCLVCRSGRRTPADLLRDRQRGAQLPVRAPSGAVRSAARPGAARTAARPPRSYRAARRDQGARAVHRAVAPPHPLPVVPPRIACVRDASARRA